MKRKLSILVFLFTILLCVGNVYAESILTEQGKIDLENKRKAIVETAKVYFKKGENIQYDLYRGNRFASPEQAGSQRNLYYVCSSYVWSVYHNTLTLLNGNDFTAMLYQSPNLIDWAGRYYTTTSSVNASGETVVQNGYNSAAGDNEASGHNILKYYGTSDDITNNLYGKVTGTNQEKAMKVEKNWSDFLKPGDIFVVNYVDSYNTGGHTMLVESIDGDEVYLLECEGKIYNATDHLEEKESSSDGSEGQGAIKRFRLSDRLKIYMDYNTVEEMALIRYLSDYDGKFLTTAGNRIGLTLSDAALTRLKYESMYINKTSNVVNREKASILNASYGDTLEYTIEIRNDSSNAYTGISIIENIDTNLVEYISADIKGNSNDNYSINYENKQLKVKDINIEAGQTCVITYKVKVNAVSGTIISTGYVNDIENSTIYNYIGNTLTDSDKEKIKNNYASVLDSSNQYEYISNIYEQILGMKFDLPTIDEIIEYDSEYNNKLTTTLVNGTLVKESYELKSMILNNFYGLEISLDGENETIESSKAWRYIVKKLNDTNTEYVDTISSEENLYDNINRTRTLTVDMLETGDIILVKEGNEEKAYIYIDDSIVRRTDSILEQNNNTNGELQEFLDNMVGKNYVILRPAQVKPTMPTEFNVNVGTNSLKIQASGSKDKTGISGYRYSLDGENWFPKNTLVSNEGMKFVTLNSGTTVNVRVVAVNELGFESSIVTKNIKLLENITDKVLIKLNTEEWTKDSITANLIYENVPEGYEIQYKKGSSNWLSGNVITDITENTTISVRLYNSVLDEELAVNSKDITNIDKTAPSKPTLIEATASLNTIKVKASGSIDNESGIAGYKYSLDNIEWTDIIVTGQTYTFDNIKSDTGVTIYTKAIDNLMHESECYGPEFISTDNVKDKVLLMLSTSNWTKDDIKVNLYYNNIPYGYIIQYKNGNGEWIDGQEVIVSENSIIICRLYNKDLEDEIAVNSIQINNIDKTSPTVPVIIETRIEDNKIYVKALGSEDIGSGLKGYKYSLDNIEWSEVIPENTEYVFNNLTRSEKTIYAMAIDNVGLTSQIKSTKVLDDIEKVKIQVNTKEWTNEDVLVEISHPNVPNGYQLQYKIGNNDWKQGDKALIESNTIVYARLYNKEKNQDIASNLVEINNIDKLSPTVPKKLEITSEINEIKVKAVGSIDEDSGIKGYKYSLDNINWSDIISCDTEYVFSGIKSNQQKIVYAIAVDNVGLVSKGISEEVYTKDIDSSIDISISKKDKKIYIKLSHSNIPLGYNIQYKINEGIWIDDVNLEIIRDAKLYVRLYNKQLDDIIALDFKEIIINDIPEDWKDNPNTGK